MLRRFGVVGFVAARLTMPVVRAPSSPIRPSEVNLDRCSRLHASRGVVGPDANATREIGGLEYERLSNAYEREYAELQRQIASAQDDETTEVAQD
jgi:hypothetical protein